MAAKAPAAAARTVLTRRAHGGDRVAVLERGAGVEAEPAEGQDQRAGHVHRHVVGRQRVRPAVRPELAAPRPDQLGADQRGAAADHVDDGRAGEIDDAVAQAARSPSWASQPPPQTHWA